MPVVARIVFFFEYLRPSSPVQNKPDKMIEFACESVDSLATNFWYLFQGGPSC